MSYVLPQVEVFQDFQQVPTEIADALRAHISGPHAFLIRYSDADEKVSGRLGEYDPNSDESYAWPLQPAGSVIDSDYVRLFIEQAKLFIFRDLLSQDETVAPVAGKRNQVRIGGTEAFVASTGFDRFEGLYRDVKAGDRVHLRGVVGGDTYELETYVLGITGDPVAASVGTADEGENNAETQVVDVDASQTEGDEVLSISASAASYNGLKDGYINDTYTLTVLEGSVDDDLTTAVLRVTTASGADDVAELVPGESGVAFDVGTRGLTVTLTGPGDLVAGDVFEVEVQSAFEQALAVSGGTYTGTKSTTYVVEVTRGGLFGAAEEVDKPQITVRTTHGVDASNGPVLVVDDNTAIDVGTKGVTIKFYGTGNASSGSGPSLVRDPVAGLRKGDVYYIEVSAESIGRLSRLILGHDMPTAMLDATDLDLEIYVLKDVEIPKNREGYDPLVNYVVTQEQFTVKSGIVLYSSDWTNGGVPVPLELEGGVLYLQYRAWRSELTQSVESIDDVGLLDDTISGSLDPDNPLKWAVFKALSNSNGTAVRFTAVADPSDVDSWADVLEKLVGSDEIYNVVPLTTDRTVQDLYAAYVDAESAPEKGRWRGAFFALTGETSAARVDATTSDDEEVVLATITDDPDTDGNQYTLVTITSGNIDLVEAGVVAGDTLRGLYGTSFGVDTYQSFTIHSIINAMTLKLATGPEGPVSVGERIEIHHPLNKTEAATAIAQKAGSFSSTRVCAVWPDTIGSGGVTFPSYHLCAALAGLRSGVSPHQPLTNVEVAGFDDVSRTTPYFNSAQLNILAASGVWIVTRTPQGVIHNRHALTTDMTDANSMEEMVRANVDSMSYVVRRRTEGFIGRSNVTPSLLSVLHVELTGIMDYLKSANFVDRLGPQLIDGSIRELRQHLIQKSRVVAVLDWTIPAPFNNLENHLVIG